MRWGGGLHSVRSVLASAGVIWAFAAVFLGSPFPYFGLIGIVAGVAGGAFLIWQSFRADAHRRQFERFAAEHGWRYQPGGTSFSSRFTGFPFQTGVDRRQSDILTGTYDGLTCSTFTHEFVTKNNRDSSGIHEEYQVTLAELPVRLPRLDLLPETIGNRLAQALGGVDVEMESHDFNSKWRVKCDDRKYAMDVVDPRMMERLLQFDMLGYAIRIEGGAVMMWHSGRLGTEDLSRRLDAVVAIAHRIPEHVLRRFREAGYGVLQGEPDTGQGLHGPSWATQGGVLNSRRYTGIGTDADGDGVEDWKRPR